jgi:hypothetical protein
VTWGVTRAVLLADSFSGTVPLDIVAYSRWADNLTAGIEPALDTAFVYPPGSSIVFLAPSFMPPELYFRTFTLLALLCDLIILISLWLAVRKSTMPTQVAPWAWIILGFAAGPLMYQRYDIFAALLGVLAILNIRRPALLGGIAGVGLLIKLWPEIAILGVPKERMVRALTANVMVIFVGWITLHAVFGNSFGFVGNVMNKGTSVEALAAYPFLLGRELSTPHIVTGQFGSWDVIGPGISITATVITIIGVFLLVGIFVLRLLGKLDHASPGDIVLLGVLIFVATHKINSMQYGIWIAAMAAAALAFAGNRALGPSILLGLMLITADSVIWTNFVPFISGNELMLGYQGLRLSLLLAATIWLGSRLFRDRQSMKPVRSQDMNVTA